MSVVLGIDCCTRWTNIGCAVDGKVVAEMNIDLGRHQASMLPILVGNLFSSLEMALSDITRVSVTAGPGYFSGIRIGLAYACSLAESLQVKVVSLCPLEMMVADFIDSDNVYVPMIRAGRSSVYGAAFALDGEKMVSLLEPKEWTPDELISAVDILGRNSKFVSCDYDRVMSMIPSNIRLWPLPCVRGANVALGGFYYGDRECSPENVRACYLREPGLGSPAK